MLIKCPECELTVSDKALSCPHCGYPLVKTNATNIKRKPASKRKRLPNGFGQISEIKNKNLRNPFRAMVTTGTNEEGRPIAKLLKPQAYFPTYNDAYEALMEYAKNPYDLDDDISVEKLYERWSTDYFGTLKGDSSIRTITSAWAYCSEIYKMRAKDVRARHIKGVIDNGFTVVKGEKRFASPNIKDRIKSLFNLMYDYAVEYELTERNYARTFNLSDEVTEDLEKARRSHIAFNDKELNILWENVNIIPWVDLVLIQCYMGWRPQELGLIKLENVNLDTNIIIGGMKTAAGTDRKVPIHESIIPLVQNRYREAKNLNSEYLFNCTDAVKGGMFMTYEKYSYRFGKIRDALDLNPEHRAHDPRKQFVTMCKKYKVDEFAIKYMAGHDIDDITEKVYTVRPDSWFAEEIAKIPKYKKTPDPV